MGPVELVRGVGGEVLLRFPITSLLTGQRLVVCTIIHSKGVDTRRALGEFHPPPPPPPPDFGTNGTYELCTSLHTLLSSLPQVGL